MFDFSFFVKSNFLSDFPILSISLFTALTSRQKVLILLFRLLSIDLPSGDSIP